MMKKTLFLAVAVCLVLSCVPLAGAQTSSPAPGTPPKVITIGREEVKVGKGAAHEKFETNFVRASARAKWPTHYLAMSALSGPSEAWYLTGYDSFAAWEQDREATEKATAFSAELDQLAEKDAEFLTNGRTIVAFFRDDLSYNPNTMDVPKARYMRVITYRVRPGHEGDFVEAAKTIRAAYEKTEVKVPWAVYQVTAGAPGPTFLIFLAMKSLQESDEGIARGKTIQAALGEENGKKLDKLASESFINIESNLFNFSPKMSYVSPEWVAANPEFWSPKAEMASRAVPAAGRKAAARTKKEGALTPAGKKEEPPKQ